MDIQYRGFSYPFKVKIKDVKELLDKFTLEEIGEIELTEIENFSSLAFARAKNLPLNELREKIKKEDIARILNENFLQSPYFEEDLETIRTSSRNFDYLIGLASNKNSIDGKYHLEDMETIKNSQNDMTIIWKMYHLAINEDSLNSPHHPTDMEALSKFVYDENIPFAVYDLFSVLTSKESLKSSHHIEDVKTLTQILNTQAKKELNQETYNIGIKLATYAKDKESLQRKTHREEMQAIIVGDEKKLEELITPKEEPKKSFVKTLKNKLRNS